MSEDVVQGAEDGGQKPDVKPEDLSVSALIVCCMCTDGKTRAVAFDDGGKQAKQVHGYIRHILGGKLTLHKEPVVIVQLDDVQKSEAGGRRPEEKPDEQTARPSWLRRFAKILKN